MILLTQLVTQTIEGTERARFIKELIRVPGPQPLAIVRKRLPTDQLPNGRYRGAVLLTHGFGQNRYAWHLTGRSFANRLARDGFDVYNLDLRGHGRSRQFGAHRPGSIDDYILADIPAALAEVRTLSGFARTYLVGHSMGGLIACSAAGLNPDAIAGVVAIGVPYRFARGSLTLATFARFVESLGELGLMRARRLRIPVKLIGRWIHLYRHAWDTSLIPIPVRAWSPGALEPRILREYLRESFDGATLGTLMQLTRLAVQGEFCSVDGEVPYGARFEACNVPLLVIAGSDDLLAPPGAVRPAYDRSRSNDKTYRVFSLGHADLVLGRDAPSTVWSLVSRWMGERADRAALPSPVALGA